MRGDWWQLQQELELQEMELDIERARQNYDRGIATEDDVKLLVWAGEINWRNHGKNRDIQSAKAAV